MNEMKDKVSLVFSYLELRRIIGIMGILMPVVLWGGALLIFGTGMQDSLSSYYHTGMRDVFVGILCVIGFFLLSYRGYERFDNITGNLACLFAVALALFPTCPEGATSNGARIAGYIHLISAALFFTTLIVFSLFLFTKKSLNPTRRKRMRNIVYIVCGWLMIACIVLIAVYSLLSDESTADLGGYHPVFWLEAVAIFVFGISWITKGEAVLKDRITEQDRETPAI